MAMTNPPKKGIKVTKTVSTVIKPVAKKDKYSSLGGEIGRPTGPTGPGRIAPTMGGAKSGKSISKAKNGKPVKKAFLGAALPILAPMAGKLLSGLGGGGGKSGGLGGMLGGLLGGKNGKSVKKAKSGAKFDLNGDGKTTRKDVLIGRGVLPKTAKKGATIKKAQNGTKVVKGSRPGMGVFRTTKERTTSGGVAEPYKYKTESIDTTGYSKGRKNYNFKTVEGEADKLGLDKVTNTKSKTITKKDVPSTLKSLNKAKSGRSIKKCAYGCK